ncbi:MAG TPA: hypothetical protein VNZ62_20185 [Capillimicrobium sp.]|nr:hypothetical protein [Capillimicrobium sp.]
MAAFSSFTDTFEADWLLLDSPTAPPVARGEADKRGFGTVVPQFEVTDAALRGHPMGLRVATLSEPGDAANVYDTTDPIDLAAQPGLAVRVRAPKTFRPGRPATVKIAVSNLGDAATERVRVRVRLGACTCAWAARATCRLSPRTGTLGPACAGRTPHLSRQGALRPARLHHQPRLGPRERRRRRRRHEGAPRRAPLPATLLGRRGRDGGAGVHPVVARPRRPGRRLADPRALLVVTYERGGSAPAALIP